MDLSAIEFENLIFDLVVVSGMVNVSWRTPGADGGRDIEGIFYEMDVSGTSRIRKWYVECKRYSQSVDWPTIYKKIAHADSHQADFLLLCTTSTFSPAAITEVERWNSQRRPLLIRLWPKHELENQLKRHPDLLLKYGLGPRTATPGKSLLAVALALSKSVSSHYSRQIFSNQSPDLMLQASQAFADLLSVRMDQLEREGGISPIFVTSTTNYVDGCDFSDQAIDVDAVGLRAFVAYLTALSRKRLKVEVQGPYSCRVAGISVERIVWKYRSVFDAIAIWADFEFAVADGVITIKQRV